jgi:hypothetical protein
VVHLETELGSNSIKPERPRSTGIPIAPKVNRCAGDTCLRWVFDDPTNRASLRAARETVLKTDSNRVNALIGLKLLILAVEPESLLRADRSGYSGAAHFILSQV